MASPSPRRKVEVRFCWMLLAAGCCWLLLTADCCLLLATATDPGALLSPTPCPQDPPPASAGIPHPGLPNTKISSLGRGTPKNGRPIHSVLAGPS